jgi:hypothetical protein
MRVPGVANGVHGHSGVKSTLSVRSSTIPEEFRETPAEMSGPDQVRLHPSDEHDLDPRRQKRSEPRPSHRPFLSALEQS